jgi:hypothetical protein
MKSGKYLSKAGQPKIVLCAVLVATFTGCASHADRPAQGSVYEEPAPRYAEPPPAIYVAPATVYVMPPGAYAAQPVVQDDYIYYPNYQVYYSSSRHQYAYREGSAWVSRPAPPGVTVSVLRASPSVKMDFHDSPENHHAAVVQKYPKNWSAAGSNEGQNSNPKDYPPNNGK